MIKPVTVPGTTNQDFPRNVEAENDDLEFGVIEVNGVKVKQTLVYCPMCGDPRIMVQATALFRLTNRSIWELAPIDQDTLRQELNQHDMPCECANCEWTGRFSDLVNYEAGTK